MDDTGVRTGSRMSHGAGAAPAPPPRSGLPAGTLA